MLDDPNFQAGEIYTTYVEQDLMKRVKMVSPDAAGAAAAKPAAGEPAQAVPLRADTRSFEVGVNQKMFKVAVTELVDPNKPALVGAVARAGASANGAMGNQFGKSEARAKTSSASATATRGEIKSTMHGLVKEVLVTAGDTVKDGQKVMIFEAMKMESDLVADRDGKVTAVKVKAGETVDSNVLLLTIGD